LYGGDTFSAKATSHELKGTRALFELKLPGLHVPLSVVCNYLGYRALVCSIVPLQSSKQQQQSSLIYGSADQCRTVACSDASCNALMSKAGAALNLKPHRVIVSAASMQSSSSSSSSSSSASSGAAEWLNAICADIEVHRGADARMYVLDTARVFCAEAPRFTIPCVLLPADSKKPAHVTDIARRSATQDALRHLRITQRRNARIIKLNGIIIVAHADHSQPEQQPVNTRACAMLLGGGGGHDSRELRGEVACFPNHKAAHLFNLLRKEYVSTYSASAWSTRAQLYSTAGHTFVTGALGAGKKKLTAKATAALHAKQHSLTPLSSDAFSYFGQHDFQQHNGEVNTATFHLNTIALGSFLSSHLMEPGNVPATGRALVQAMHRAGINVRYLGKLRAMLNPRQLRMKNIKQRAQHLCQLALTEMVARVSKDRLQAILRSEGAMYCNDVDAADAGSGGGVVTRATTQRDCIRRVLSELNFLLIQTRSVFSDAITDKERRAVTASNLLLWNR
jgi:hypothetical protein